MHTGKKFLLGFGPKTLSTKHEAGMSDSNFNFSTYKTTKMLVDDSTMHYDYYSNLA